LNGGAAVPFLGGGGGAVTAQSQFQQQLFAQAQAQAMYQQQLMAAARQMQAAREFARLTQSSECADRTGTAAGRTSGRRAMRNRANFTVAATYGMSERERQMLRNGLASR
jgi:hypothetical protein